MGRSRNWLLGCALLACLAPGTRAGAQTATGSAAAAPGAKPAGPAASRPSSVLDELRGLPRDRAGDRGQAMARHKRAMVEHAAKRYDAAEQLWAEAARLDPSWDWPYYNLACVASRVGRLDDALAYLEAVRARRPSFEMLRRIETDHDLDAVRARPPLKPLIQQIAADLLVGPYSAVEHDADRPAPRLPADSVTGCHSLKLGADGKYTYECAAGFTVGGEWAYDGGVLFYRATSFGYAVGGPPPDTGEAPGPPEVNDYGAVAVTYLAGGYLCLAAAHPRNSWPTPRALGKRAASPEGAMAIGCLQSSMAP